MSFGDIVLCTICGLEAGRRGHGGRPPLYCVDCRAKREKERRSTPEYREKRAVIRRAYQQTEAGKEVMKRAHQKWDKSPAGRASKRAAYKRWYETERGKKLDSQNTLKYQRSERGKQVRAEWWAAYYESEHGQMQLWRKRLRRRARLAKVTFHITDKDLRRLDRSPCQACGTTDNLSVDHLIPIARGGTHGIGNLITLCRLCNSVKGTLTWMEWRLSDRVRVPVIPAPRTSIQNVRMAVNY